jgi:hypothetical protein
MRPYLKKKKKSKKGLVECLKQGVGPEFKPQYCKKKKSRELGLYKFDLSPGALPYSFVGKSWPKRVQPPASLEGRWRALGNPCLGRAAVPTVGLGDSSCLCRPSGNTLWASVSSSVSEGLSILDQPVKWF